jgi:hypothetical protein
MVVLERETQRKGGEGEREREGVFLSFVWNFGQVCGVHMCVYGYGSNKLQ